MLPLLLAAAATAVAQHRFAIPGHGIGAHDAASTVSRPRGQFNAHAVDDETAAALKAIANKVAAHRAETHEEDTSSMEDETHAQVVEPLSPQRRTSSRDVGDEELLAAVQRLAGEAAPAKQEEATSPAVTEQYNEIAETLKRRRLCSAGQYYTKKKGKWFKKSVRCMLVAVRPALHFHFSAPICRRSTAMIVVLVCIDHFRLVPISGDFILLVFTGKYNPSEASSCRSCTSGMSSCRSLQRFLSILKRVLLQGNTILTIGVQVA